MAIFQRIFNSFAKRAAINNPNDPIWRDLFATAVSKAGASVTPESALKVSAVYACIRVLSETIASLPLKIYRRDNSGKVVAKDHFLYPLLHDSPNEWTTGYEFFETLVAHICLRGNSYNLKRMDGMRRLGALNVLDPSKMTPAIEGGELVYRYIWPDGREQTFTQDEIWHTKGLSTDGIVGLSPITQARESIGLALATEEYGARLFSNNARPGGILEHPGRLTEDSAKRLKENWQSAHAGGKNSHKVAILEEGMKWTSIGFANDDAQFLETRNFQVEDIARIYRVPSVLIGHPDKSSTYASAEQFFLSFVVHTIRPWITRIEQSINKYLIPERDKKTYFAEFQLDGLLRGDTKSRYESYAIARQNKWMSANEIREKENMNPIEGGDEYENPNITVNQDTPEPVPSEEAA